MKGARGGNRSARAGTTKKAKPATGTDWERLHDASDAEIRAGIDSDPEAHPTDDDFWKDAKVVWPQPKQVVTIRLDADLLEWLRHERGYQTRINAILRSYMNARKSQASAPSDPS